MGYDAVTEEMSILQNRVKDYETLALHRAMSKVTIEGANMDGTSTFRGGTPAKKSQLIAECMEECKAFIQQEVHKSLS